MALRVPNPFKTCNGCSFSSIEAVSLLLARFRSAGDIFELSRQYDRSQASLSQLVNELCQFINDTWSHLLDFDHQYLLSKPKLIEYAHAIHKAGAPLASVWAFLDCTLREICSPTWFQRVVYNGHKKFHALKYQVLKLPNGLIGHLYGPIEGRHNDNFLLTDSNLLEMCAAHANHPNIRADRPIHEWSLQIFGDPAYGLNPYLISPYTRNQQSPDEHEWNQRMAKVWIEVEHGFADITRTWPFLNAWWKQKIFASPVGTYYRVGALLSNALNCIRPNQTAQAFECEPPTLEEYFHDQ